MCSIHTIFQAFVRSIFYLCFVASAFANAAIIDSGRTTIDTSTGLEWLDLTETVGISYLEVEKEAAPGGNFEGYRHASEQEVLGVFFSIFEGQGGAANEHHLRFLELFGVTQRKYEPYSVVYGYADPGGNYENVAGKDYSVVPVYGLRNMTSDGVEVFRVVQGELRHNPSLEYPGFGNYLVRDYDGVRPVPEIDGGSAPLALAVLLMFWLMLHERRLNSGRPVKGISK